MNRDDLHVLVLAVLLVVFYIGQKIAPDPVSADLMKLVTGGLLALVVNKAVPQKP